MQMIQRRNLLFLLAHQDDEVFVASKLAFELERGAILHVAYLTSGVAATAGSIIRERESEKFLARLGIAEEQLTFLGREVGIADARLVEHLEVCLQGLMKKFYGTIFDEIYAPAWEGGHHDHDAAFLIGVALSQHLGIEANFWQFYLYNGYKTPHRFFRVFDPLPVCLERQVRKLTIKEGLATLRAIFLFKSQWRTWLGLFPQCFLHLVFVRKEILDRGSISQLAGRPHDGKLLYERWNRISYSEFRKKSFAFEQKYITSQGQTQSQYASGKEKLKQSPSDFLRVSARGSGEQ
jgi:LmbE family N-acetylglucosaminyl deacetylase